MPQAFTDRELDQQDAVATKRAHAADWQANKPTKGALHPVFADILAAHGMPQGKLLEARADKAGPRRFSGEPITDFGAL